jgi:hypothetical protein
MKPKKRKYFSQPAKRTGIRNRRSYFNFTIFQGKWFPLANYKVLPRAWNSERYTYMWSY